MRHEFNQLQMCAWNYCPKQLGLQRNFIYSATISRWTEAVWTNHSATEAYLSSKQWKNINTDDLMVILLEKKSKMSCKNWSIDSVSTHPNRWNAKRLFTSNPGIFSRSWIEKIWAPAWKHIINSILFYILCIIF